MKGAALGGTRRTTAGPRVVTASPSRYTSALAFRALSPLGLLP